MAAISRLYGMAHAVHELHVYQGQSECGTACEPADESGHNLCPTCSVGHGFHDSEPHEAATRRIPDYLKLPVDETGQRSTCPRCQRQIPDDQLAGHINWHDRPATGSTVLCAS